jgi:hypothetical protein
MKSDRNIIFDILAANGVTIGREDITQESIKILRDYGHEMYTQGEDDTVYGW